MNIHYQKSIFWMLLIFGIYDWILVMEPRLDFNQKIKPKTESKQFSFLKKVFSTCNCDLILGQELYKLVFDKAIKL